ncbi:SIS domain-containing protein [Victivallis sp. Marseille-Q1083]|uniref:D-sedoheptulose-7-phosphate isomerase n=1 Tax=Victivallis sp. Marseille-Q1083 TaxID=2717288 RepID=UPI00158A297E|nr:SIS domain-containing protein [Victivallis sp. Marseille-Q1083]
MTASEHIEQLMKRRPELAGCREELISAIALLVETFSSGHRLFLCGNGGSCADAEHIAGELLKSFLLPRSLPESDRRQFKQRFGERGEAVAARLQCGLPTMTLHGHPGLLTAFANDVDPYNIYAQQLYVFGNAGDLLLGISTSGNAENVARAMMTAQVKSIKTLLLTGADGGRCASLADLVIRVPERETYRIQECHLPIYHMLCQAVEEHFYGTR